MSFIDNYRKYIFTTILSLFAFLGGRVFENKKIQKQSDIDNYKALISKLPDFEKIIIFFTKPNLIGEFPKKTFFEFGKKIIEHHIGGILVESSQGKGSIFQVILPAKQSH